ncbi:two-component system, response regulator YesN [Paenibacillus catalpae]|uniref:Two-component system, response regulator YesN n=1 Tax=Paenibacillus catalpae TaxID=1045775 RepID=A0A1I1SXW3_9BACL|nr:helix-turn-helix domain-containing protein [Paenibacillus catalpae]SFD48773.1 two-component system, response regulator YesN [Paenibacillus catalpae]
MINLLVVDDEPLVRLVLRHMITSLELDIHIVGEASDGQEALQFMKNYHHVDIVCVDIQMPKMNGLEFLRCLSQLEDREPVYPIVLSAFNDYDYVREAFVNGAKDYVLKASMDEGYLAPILTKAVDEVRKLKESMSSHSVSTSVHMDRSQASPVPISNQEELLIAALLDNACADESARSEALAALKARLGEGNLTAASIKLSSPSSDNTRGFIKQTIMTVIESHAIPHFIINLSPDEYMLLMSLSSYRSITSAREKLHAVLTTVSIRLKQFMNASVAIGVSGFGRRSGEWLDLAKQASHAADLSYYRGFDKVFFPEAVTRFREEQHSGSESYIDQLQQSRGSLVKALKKSDAAHWKEQFKQYHLLLDKADGIRSQVIIAGFNDLIWEVGSILYTNGLRWQQLQEGFDSPLAFLTQFKTMKSALAWIEEIFTKIHALLHANEVSNHSKYSQPVAKAKQFLDKHFCEDITLPLISQMVGVSESYLSKQFSKEVGRSFIQYLTKLRIDEAQRLMASGMKVSEVSNRVGYMNPEHFSRLFKKMMGQSPKSHRDTISVL